MTPAHVASFEAARPRLFGIAYRTLESAADADDVVQDAWIRWQGTNRSEVRDAAAFLATTTKRLALNVVQSARVRRETSIDPWDLEPVDVQADPTLGAERREALELAMRMLMEKLSPSERAAYVLREAFDYPHRQIAEVLATSEANARQLVNRARIRLVGEARWQVSAAEQQRFTEAFAEAAQTGDLAALEQLLAPVSPRRPTRAPAGGRRRARARRRPACR
jgi:RNA polymerase sigma-70 factor, ECF subfamily